MSYIDLFDELNYQFVKEELDIDWEVIDEVFDNNSYRMIKCVDWFISNLDPNHEIPGSEYETLLGIANWARENEFATTRQFRYVVMTIAKNWNYFRRI